MTDMLSSQHYAPKHGVRLISTRLDLWMVVPLLLSEPTVAIDLEGDLTPSDSCCVDMIQAYLPTSDVVLLIHSASIAPAEISRALKPWLESAAHCKLLCDARADSDALQYAYGIRLAGVSDVQLAHAMVTGELRSVGLTPGDSTFFFPTGLSRLTSQYCGEQVGAPLVELKTHFSALFNSGEAPFRHLPLTPAAVTYAASDAWHVWLVHCALQPRIEAAGLAPLLNRASENRAGEFRDVVGGRALWEERMARAKRERNSRKTGLRERVAKAKADREHRPGVEASASAKRKRATSAAEAPLGGAATSPPPRKQRVVSGPACACCGVAFSSSLQLEEHLRGKHHAMVAKVVQRVRLAPLRLSADTPLDEAAVRCAMAKYGDVRRLTVSNRDEGQSDGMRRPWEAVLEYSSNAEVGKVLGQKKALLVNGAKVSAVVLSEEAAEAMRKKRSEGKEKEKEAAQGA